MLQIQDPRGWFARPSKACLVLALGPGRTSVVALELSPYLPLVLRITSISHLSTARNIPGVLLSLSMTVPGLPHTGGHPCVYDAGAEMGRVGKREITGREGRFWGFLDSPPPPTIVGRKLALIQSIALDRPPFRDISVYSTPRQHRTMTRE